jgi:hypothetical protein
VGVAKHGDEPGRCPSLVREKHQFRCGPLLRNEIVPSDINVGKGCEHPDNPARSKILGPKKPAPEPPAKPAAPKKPSKPRKSPLKGRAPGKKVVKKTSKSSRKPKGDRR